MMKLEWQAGISLSGSSARETALGLHELGSCSMHLFIWGCERSLGASNFLESNDIQKNIFTGIPLKKKKSECARENSLATGDRG